MQTIKLETINVISHVQFSLIVAEFCKKKGRKNYVVKYDFVDNCVRTTDCISFQYILQKIAVASIIFYLSI